MSFLINSLLKKIKCLTKKEEKEIPINLNNNELNNEHQPGINFSRITSLYRGAMEDNWDGIKFNLSFKPNQFFNLDYSLIVQKGKNILNNTSLSTSCFIPNSQNNNSGILLVGKKELPESILLQSHIFFSDKERLELLTQIPKKDFSNNIYSIEYVKEFNRLNTSIKLSSDLFSISTITSIYKNLFCGFEAYKNPDNYSIGYNYTLFNKITEKNNFGFAFNYLSALPGYVIDFCYKVNNKFTIFLNYAKNNNILIQQLGGQKSDSKITVSYKDDSFDTCTEYNKEGLFKFIVTYYIMKNMGLLWNFVIDPKQKIRRKKISHFGFGIHFHTTPLEEELQNIIKKNNEINVEDYNYEKIMKGYKI